jgi:hypothetical protein
MSFSALGYEKRHQCLRGMVRHSQEGTIILLGNDLKKQTKKQYTLQKNQNESKKYFTNVNTFNYGR